MLLLEMPLKKFPCSLLSVFLLLLPLSQCLAGQKRTNGPPGSEYGDFNQVLNGDLQVGLHFGTLVNPTTDRNSSFSLGADLDYRPYEVFGFRASYFQGMNSPRASVFSLTPLMHFEYSNMHSYVLAGPGIALVNQNHQTKTKFEFAAGLGADFMLNDYLGLGVEYVWNSIIDASDLHLIGARTVIAFPSW